jgi:hypothetical protein
MGGAKTQVRLLYKANAQDYVQLLCCKLLWLHSQSQHEGSLARLDCCSFPPATTHQQHPGPHRAPSIGLPQLPYTLTVTQMLHPRLSQRTAQ